MQVRETHQRMHNWKHTSKEAPRASYLILGVSKCRKCRKRSKASKLQWLNFRHLLFSSVEKWRSGVENAPLGGPGSASCRHLRPGQRAGRVGPRGGPARQDAMPCALPGDQVAAGHKGWGGFPRMLASTGCELGLADLGAAWLSPPRALGADSGMGLVLLLRGDELAALTATEAVIRTPAGAHQTYRRKPPTRSILLNAASSGSFRRIVRAGGAGLVAHTRNRREPGGGSA